ncbi:hypothetical protein SAMN05216207_106418 [Pseudonocardia ammonioxydans]|uniref:Uncharacterized protein n=1 Tax=Pseudonocardia ammonioxydans TaxID=260086 RepID=A0A1I5HFX6_PSUAM|nr:hypothetical protein SAMN05216207_106418 [Pseudonocardia ammonioxydans]
MVDHCRQLWDRRQRGIEGGQVLGVGEGLEPEPQLVEPLEVGVHLWVGDPVRVGQVVDHGSYRPQILVGGELGQQLGVLGLVEGHPPGHPEYEVGGVGELKQEPGLVHRRCGLHHDRPADPGGFEGRGEVLGQVIPAQRPVRGHPVVVAALDPRGAPQVVVGIQPPAAQNLGG